MSNPHTRNEAQPCEGVGLLLCLLRQATVGCPLAPEVPRICLPGRIKNAKMKDGPDGAEFILKPSPVLDSVVLSAVADTPTSEENTASQRAILHALAEVFGQTDGASTSELIEVTGQAKSTFYLARGALLKTGQIVSNGHTGRQRLRLPESNAVQSTDNPVTSTFPISPTGSNGSGPVQSSPTPLIGVGRWTPDSGTLDGTDL